MISVIVPVYKVEKYLDTCVRSILNQTWQDFELLLVDDGSPDNCGTMCDEWALKDSRIQVIHKVNGGLSDARNAGIDRAKGEYFLFVDSDDSVREDMLETLVTLAKETRAEIACCNFIRLDEEGNQTKEIIHQTPGLLTPDEYWAQCFAQKKERSFYEVVWNKLYRRELFEKNRFAVGKIHEDSLIMHHLIAGCKAIAITDKIGYCYLQRQSSIMGAGQSLKSLSGPEAHINRTEFFMEEGKWEFAAKSLDIAINFLVMNTFGEKGKQSQEYRALKKRAWQVFRRLSPRVPWGRKLRILLYFISEPLARRERMRRKKG